MCGNCWIQDRNLEDRRLVRYRFCAQEASRQREEMSDGHNFTK